MLTLKTGVPGSGKTLTLVDELRKACQAEAPRATYVHGIPDLALPVLPLPVYAPVQQTKQGQAQVRNTLEVEWSVVPDGALVVIDEAQHLFPVRGAGSAVPGYVSWLNTHRHRGIDIVLITQHPRLIDSAVRKLVGKHQHYRRLWGGQRHVCYEWDHCSEALTSMETAQKSVHEFPKRAFSAYKSAEVHTKQKFSKPLWLLVPVLALVGAVFVGPKAFEVLSGSMSGKGIGAGQAEAPASAPGAPGAPIKPGMTPAQALAAGVTSALPSAAPDPRVKVAATFPAALGGCWITPGACQCVTNETPPRILRDLGELCADVANGRLAPDPSRPKPARAEEAPPVVVAAALPPPPPSAPRLGL